MQAMTLRAVAARDRVLSSWKKRLSLKLYYYMHARLRETKKREPKIWTGKMMEKKLVKK